jgi:hypothetical protein
MTSELLAALSEHSELWRNLGPAGMWSVSQLLLLTAFIPGVEQVLLAATSMLERPAHEIQGLNWLNTLVH